MDEVYLARQIASSQHQMMKTAEGADVVYSPFRCFTIDCRITTCRPEADCLQRDATEP
ncbi:hypothetical protein EV132_12440 [Rhizobium sullae]|uniref:Uncharacterized protein n=1 Tax=Rhizobium sullae TaxID=50338 RepID=A0A4R3PUB7_RHISU|nr:hypothetical protein EV132_12440 [Rhizobium sullae]